LVESTTTRTAGSLDFTAIGGKRQGYAVPQSLKTTRFGKPNQLVRKSWPKTTTHGSGRTTHVEKRHVMETDKQLSVIKEAVGKVPMPVLFFYLKKIILASCRLDA